MPPACERGNGRGERLVARAGIGARAVERKSRTAIGTGERFGMEAPIERVLVFAPAARTEREARHRGVRPIVGQGLDDRVARSALRAIREGIAIAACGRILQFLGAKRATERIRRQMHVCGLAVRARENPEIARAFDRGRRRGREPRPRERRRLADQRGLVAAEVRRRPFDVNDDLARAVAHPARELQRTREPIDEGPKADALHLPADDEAPRARLEPRRQYRAGPGPCTACLSPEAHQMRHAPSSETMQGPTGSRGVQARPNSTH